MAALVATCGVLGCTPFAGISPTPGAVSPASARGFRLKGTVSLNDAPVPNVHMRAFDLATGKELVLVPYTEQGLPRPATPTRTLADAQGAFDYELPAITSDQIIKVVAEWDGKALVGLVDGTGRTVGGVGEGSKYSLAQAVTTLQLTITLKLTAATTSAAKSFEGALKTTFQLRGKSAAATLEQAMKAAAAAIADVEKELNKRPEVQTRIAEALDDRGEFDPTASFQTIMNGVNLTELLLSKIEPLLEDFANKQEAEKPANNPALDAITQEDFPLGRIQIKLDGGFVYTNGDGKTIDGNFNSGQFVPNDQPSAAPSAAPTTAPSAAPTAAPTTAPTAAPTAAPGGGSGGSGGNGNTDNNSTTSGSLSVATGTVVTQDPNATLTCEYYEDENDTEASPCVEIVNP